MSKDPEKKPLVTRMVAGNSIPVPIVSVWPAICQVIKMARLISQTPPYADPTNRDTFHVRMGMMAERLHDIESMNLHYDGTEPS